jgi:hypothetical protein
MFRKQIGKVCYPWNYWTLKRVESMTILLMDESFLSNRRLPNLLIVWQNVNSSVEMLEVSLTVTRCVQTTSVVNDLISNVMLLGKFVSEILQYGWIRGVTVIATELVHLHSTGTDPLALWHGAASPAGASYTSAIISLIRNADIIRRNINVLSNEEKENLGKVIAPILGFLALIIGQGWLWGRHESPVIRATNETTKSTIEIVELNDNEDIDGTNCNPKTFAGSDQLTQNPDRKMTTLKTDRDGSQTLASLSSVAAVDNTLPAVLQLSQNQSLEGSPSSTDNVLGKVVSGNDRHISAVRSTDMQCELDTPIINSHSDDSTGAERIEKSVNARMITVDHFAEMMELLSRCDEYEILNNFEKHVILEKLAEYNGVESNAFSNWFCTIKNNLQNLLQSREVVNSCLSNLLVASELLPESIDSVTDSKISLLSDMNEPNDLNDHISMVSDIDPLDQLQLEADEGRGALSVSIDAEETAQNTSQDMTETGRVQLAECWSKNKNEVDEGRIIEDAKFVREVENEMTCNEVIMLEKQSNSEDEENIWLKVGSGIAIVGGIVGSIVMMNAAKNRNHDQEKRR